MVLEIQQWPGAWRVRRMLLGRNEGRRRAYIASVLDRADLEVSNFVVLLSLFLFSDSSTSFFLSWAGAALHGTRGRLRLC